MSKSKGNVVNPFDTINTYGADIAKFMDRMREKGHI